MIVWLQYYWQLETTTPNLTRIKIWNHHHPSWICSSVARSKCTYIILNLLSWNLHTAIRRHNYDQLCRIRPNLLFLNHPGAVVVRLFLGCIMSSRRSDLYSRSCFSILFGVLCLFSLCMYYKPVNCKNYYYSTLFACIYCFQLRNGGKC